jgi:hypothetical protein
LHGFFFKGLSFSHTNLKTRKREEEKMRHEILRDDFRCTGNDYAEFRKWIEEFSDATKLYNISQRKQFGSGEFYMPCTRPDCCEEGAYAGKTTYWRLDPISLDDFEESPKRSGALTYSHILPLMPKDLFEEMSRNQSMIIQMRTSTSRHVFMIAGLKSTYDSLTSYLGCKDIATKMPGLIRNIVISRAFYECQEAKMKHYPLSVLCREITDENGRTYKKIIRFSGSSYATIPQSAILEVCDSIGDFECVEWEITQDISKIRLVLPKKNYLFDGKNLKTTIEICTSDTGVTSFATDLTLSDGVFSWPVGNVPIKHEKWSDPDSLKNDVLELIEKADRVGTFLTTLGEKPIDDAFKKLVEESLKPVFGKFRMKMIGRRKTLKALPMQTKKDLLLYWFEAMKLFRDVDNTTVLSEEQNKVIFKVLSRCFEK